MLIVFVLVISDIHQVSAQPLTPAGLWSAWNTEFIVLFPLEITVFVYVWGVWNIWRRAGRGHGVSYKRCAAFVGAILALGVALVSPLDILSGALFSAHMAQHLILILVAAPLLVLSDFSLVLLWALPGSNARRIGRKARGFRPWWLLITQPVFAWTLFTVTIWGWHVPSLYQAALENNTIHAFEHLSFLVTAMLFWRVLIHTSSQKHTRYGIAVLYLFTSAMQGGILGALLTFASQPWYPLYESSTRLWGVTPIQDQQFAGLIMWLPVGAIFTLLAVLYFGAWLRAVESRMTQELVSTGQNSEA